MPEVLYWGERGLVTTLVRDLDELGIEGWRWWLDLLRPENSILPPSDHLKDVLAIIEPSFGSRGFGHPDLILKLTYAEAEPFVFFVEAKLTSYLRASSRQRTSKDFNSKINGQIELNHRLALALSEFSAGDKSLSEPIWILDCVEYEPLEPDVVRRVDRPPVLHNLASKLCGLPMSNYGHIILTNDVENPIDQIPEELQPQIVKSRQDREDWSDFKTRLLWGGWQSIYDDMRCSNFRNTYEILELQPDHSPPALPGRDLRGVSLVLLEGQQDYLYLSWRRGSYRLRDYNGNQRVDLSTNKPLSELLSQIKREIPVKQSERRPYDDFEFWAAKSVEAKEN